jgi:hypothetical protein
MPRDSAPKEQARFFESGIMKRWTYDLGPRRRRLVRDLVTFDIIGNPKNDGTFHLGRPDPASFSPGISPGRSEESVLWDLQELS